MALHAPYGTDEQPSVNVKIVASKTLEVNGINGGKYDSLSRTPFKYSSRPPWFLDDFSGETKRSNKPHLASISSLSSNEPGGKSVRKTHESGVAKSVGEMTERNVNKEDDPSENEAVDFMLSRLLSEFPAAKFKEIYTEMAGFDPRLTSYITEHQVETTLKRHKVPVPSNILKQLLYMFASEPNTNMINYENLIKYLFSHSLKGSSLKEPPHQRKPSNELKIDKIDNHDTVISPRNDPQAARISPRSDQSSYVSPRGLVKKAMDDREEAYLLVQIEQAFKTNGLQILTTLERLQSDLKKLGNGTEYIKADQIGRTCSWLHLPLHHSLLEKILNRLDVKKNGKIKWMEFSDFLRKGVPLSLEPNSSQGFDKISARTSLPFWESQTPLGPVSPRKHTQEETSSSRGYTATKNEIHRNEIKSERKKWEVPSTMDIDNTLPDNLERSYDVLKVGRGNNAGSAGTVHVMQFNPDAGEKPDSTDSEKMAESLDEKLERFSHLTAALLRSDVDKNGTLKARDVLRIVNSYNLIYNLHFPEDRVLEIAQQCTVPNTHEVVIDELVKVLWELMKTV